MPNLCSPFLPLCKNLSGRRLAGAILARSHGDLALEELLTHADWSHPAQVLESPRPTIAELLAALRRLEDPPRQVSADRLAEIEERLEQLVRIEKRAGRRRRQTSKRVRERGIRARVVKGSS